MSSPGASSAGRQLAVPGRLHRVLHRPHRRVRPGYLLLTIMLGLGAFSRARLASRSARKVVLSRQSYTNLALQRPSVSALSSAKHFLLLGRAFHTTPPRPNSDTSSKPTNQEQGRDAAKRRSILSRFLPAAIAADTTKSASSFRKIVALASPEKKPLGIAIGLLLVSSSVSMSIPFTIGKLIDYFTSANPVSLSYSSSAMLVLNAVSSKCHSVCLWGKHLPCCC